MDSKQDDSSRANDRFAGQTAKVEDVLKAQTVGLVKLDEFRKRRVEALESGQSTPSTSDRYAALMISPNVLFSSLRSKYRATPSQPTKKKKKAPVKGKLSFGADEEEGEDTSNPAVTSRSTTATPRSNTPLDTTDGSGTPRLGPNTSIAFAPKVLTKAAIAKEAETRERLKKEFLSMQVLVKATDFILPFVFYDGTNVPGGVCRMKKGDPVWLFLDKSRKVGAELGSGTDKSRREWARVGVDDLMLVRNEIIIPHVSTTGIQEVRTS